jgi:catechol 2,3-dioxygenase-like lactoylglutathione lyase family enzyme
VAFTLFAQSRLWEWYREAFQLLPSGATLFFGPPAAKVNGLPWPVFPGHWLLDGQSRFQLEFFRFLRPRPSPRRADERPNDIGYRRVGIHTVEFDATLRRLERLGSKPLGEILGPPGDRRACFRDPEGNLIEILERDPLEGLAPPKALIDVPSTVRFVTISVPDLEAARAAWVDKLGMEVAPVGALHSTEHEALWGLEGARRKSLTLQGGGVLVELVEYEEPRGRPLPEDHRICDPGIMNIALGARDREEFDRVFARWVAQGLRPTSPTPLDVGIFRVMYFRTPTGESVELLYPRRWAWSLTGFRPRGHYIGEEVLLRARPEAVWPEVADHDRLGQWSAFASQLVEPGEAERHGVGALRRVRVLGLPFEERVLHFAPPVRLSYTVERGPLVRRHRGDVVLVPVEGGTRVRWAIRLELAIPGLGTLAALALRRKLRTSLRRLRERVEG